MFRFKSAPVPADFEKRVSNTRVAVTLAIIGKTAPDFTPKWSDFKDALSAAQYRKCGFCESKFVGVGFGDVEHFRPKSEIERLADDESTWGFERPNLGTVEGRKPVREFPTGYWWQAYQWDNYLLACTVCNQQWKMAIFPIKESPRQNAPAEQTQETPLLLNPFVGPSPAEHLEFGRLGEIRAHRSSDYGRETIRTCGLDRPSLREFRIDLARKTHRRIDDLGDPQLTAREFDRVLRDIYEDGDERGAYCGMVRAIYEQRTGTTWEDLAALVSTGA